MATRSILKLFPLCLLSLALSCKKDCPDSDEAGMMPKVSLDGKSMMPNASFEGEPKQGSALTYKPFNLENWQDCGFPGQTAPDIHPGSDGGFFGVTTLPFDGQTYIGLIVRENDTYESVSTKLDFPLKANQKYDFSIAACYSEVYTYINGSQEIFNDKAARLRIWGGTSDCPKEELLAESETVSNTDWKVLEFVVQPSANYEYVRFEAYYVEGTTLPYNGNLLLDKASAFEPE